MENRHAHPFERLRRDLAALGDSPARPSATERLTAMLGDDLLAAILTELRRLEAADVPLGKRPRRAA
jgi:hypothetical protein